MKKNGSNEAALVILVAAIFALWSASQIMQLAVLALLFCLWTYRRLRLGKAVKLRRIWLYLGMIPFAIWFAAFRSTPGGFSPLFFYIPAWYFLYLALVEWLCVGRGGRMVFVWFDAFVVFTLSSFEASAAIGVAFGVATLALLWDVRSKKNFALWLLFWIGFFLLLLAAKNLNLDKRSDYATRAARYENDYHKRTLMGFSSVGALTAFSKNYSGEFEDDVVFRVYSKRMPLFLKGIAYERYLPKVGLWKQSKQHRFLQTGRFVGDYGGFEVREPFDSTAVWVQSNLSVEKALFAPPGAAGVALKNIDSLPHFAGDFFLTPERSPRNWYYWDGIRTRDTLTQNDSAWLQVPNSLLPLLDSAVLQMELSLSKDSLKSNLKKIRTYFDENFKYQLSFERSEEDPLEDFYRKRRGFCSYFASFSTLLLRHLGIPARYASGFAYPEIGEGYWIFRRRTAHGWVEFLDADEYWNTFDPTPVSARLQNGEPSRFERLSERLRSMLSLAWHELTEGRWRTSLDSFTNWISNVFESLTFKLFLGVLLIGSLAWWVVRCIRIRQKERENVSKRILELRQMLEKAESKLSGMGYVRNQGETAWSFLQRIPSTPKTEPFRQMLVSYCLNRWRSL